MFWEYDHIYQVEGRYETVPKLVQNIFTKNVIKNQGDQKNFLGATKDFRTAWLNSPSSLGWIVCISLVQLCVYSIFISEKFIFIKFCFSFLEKMKVGIMKWFAITKSDSKVSSVTDKCEKLQKAFVSSDRNFNFK